MKKYWFALLAIFGLWLIQSPQPTQAATTVVLHPRQVIDNLNVPNTGAAMSELAALPTVAGVTYSAYDITTLFNEKSRDQSIAAAQASIASNWEQLGVGYTPVATATAQDDAITFKDLPTTQDSLDRVYLFTQTAGPTGLLKPQPTVLGLDGTDRDYVLYPKSTGASLTVSVAGEPIDSALVASVPRGAVLTYTAKFTIPSDIAASLTNASGTFASLTVATAMSAAGTQAVADSLAVTVAGQPVVADWLSLDTPITLAALPQPAKAALAALAGQTITVSYQRQVVDPQPTADLANTLTVTWAGSGEPSVLTADSAAVETGGQRFAAINPFSKDGVAGGAFVVAKTGTAPAQYAKFSATTLNWVSDPAAATSFSAAADGSFAVTGLAAGDYQLEQLAAADGYRFVEPLTPFTVASGRPGTAENAVKTVFQTPLTGILPATGGLSLLVLLIAGTLLTGWGLHRRRHASA
ncbi:pilin N-terminal domain-containing protein [Lacticaseibacillus parakribbianus]|uniref:pilin N-terminal domain-containing protein n=1 Tax=Lacticaseibacillus parakribbianus TaxID=2970927 RepID=UPI0021CB83DD|nr:pilin N-terminal domain-containing protein [Lacticaseibacillus parakribbianus]